MILLYEILLELSVGLNFCKIVKQGDISDEILGEDAVAAPLFNHFLVEFEEVVIQLILLYLLKVLFVKNFFEPALEHLFDFVLEILLIVEVDNVHAGGLIEDE